MKYYGIDLAEGSEINNLTVDIGTSFPSNANAGELFYKTDEGLFVHNGTTWNNIAVGNTIGYTHTQNSSNETWNIQHNLGTTNIQITTYVEINSVMTYVLPSNIIVTNSNNIQVIFSQARTGKVVIVGVL